MDDVIRQRISRLYAAIKSIEEHDPQKLKATVIQTDRFVAMLQDYRSGLSDDELSNQAHSVIHNIANLRDHLRKWASHNAQDKSKVTQVFKTSTELKTIQDLSNNDKHGYSPQKEGHSGYNSPQLIGINRVMRLQTRAQKGSTIMMTIGADGVPQFIGDGAARAVVTGDIVDKDGNCIGDLYEIASKAVEAWEDLLSDYGLRDATSGN